MPETIQNQTHGGSAADGAASLGHTAESAESPVHQLQQQLEQAYARRKLDIIDDSTPAAACVKPLLLALDWTGEARHLEEALPHFDTISDVDDVRALLARLHYQTQPVRLKAAEIRASMVPCLFATDSGRSVSVIFNVEDNGDLFVFDGAERALRTLKPGKESGTAYRVLHVCKSEAQQDVRNYGWLQGLLRRFRRAFATLFLLSFAINMLALSVPFYILNVYDKAIGAKSPSTLFFFLAGVAIVVVAELGLRSARTRAVAFLGARFEALLSIGALEKLLHLPAAMTVTAPVSAQLTRLKQFEGIRDIFTGSLANAALDLPFAVVFLAAIFVISGTLGFVPLGLLLIFIGITLITIPLTRNHVKRTGESKTRARNFLMELTEKRQTICENAAEGVWLDRFSDLSGTYLLRQFKAQQLNTLLQVISQALVIMAGVLTVGLGALQVLDGNLSVGALIAIVALVWRLLSPLQALFLGLNQVGRTLETFQQINNMMRLETERQPGQLPTFFREFRGHIKLVGVGFRYASMAEPALRGLSFDIPPGQVVAIVGDSDSGKSTVLKLVAGLFQPQVGAVRVDGLDLRQIDPAELRQAIGYAPQKPEFFYGTIAQNLKLAEPTASRAAMTKALEEAAAREKVAALPMGLETRLKTVNRHNLPDGLLQQLVLARAYVKNAPMLLLDAPGSRLDKAADEALIRHLHALRGRTTVLLVTHRPSHMYAADRVIVLQQGIVAADGAPSEIVPRLLQGAQSVQAGSASLASGGHSA
ncbi:MAG: peptidase domain-containing ABC transporter [Methyloligellaceae bacterium]